MAAPLDKKTYEALKRRNLAFYAQETLTGPPEYGGRFIIAEHHEKWCEIIQKHRRICTVASRDHSKSWIHSKALMLWVAEKNPGRQGYIFSASQDTANERLDEIRQEVERNPKLKHLLPSKGSKSIWGTKAIRLANGFTIKARGWGAKSRGGHPVIAICDDVMGDDTAYSDVIRQRGIDYFYQAVEPMVVPGGWLVVVGTPMHSQDLLAKLRDDPTFVYNEFPAIDDNWEKPLWPGRYSKQALMDKRASLGSIRFSREYLCKAISDLSSLFPGALFIGDPVEQPYRLGMPLSYWKERDIHNVFAGVDFGLSSSVDADYTVVWVMGLDTYGNRWILDIYRERGLDYQDQLGLIKQAGRKYKPDLIYCEAVQAQRIFGEELQRTTDLPIINFHTSQDKHADTGGLPALRVLLENRKYRIPRSEDERTQERIDAWIGEMQGLTVEKGKIVTVADHDDLPMANWLCEKAIAEGSFSFSFEEQEGDREAFEEMMAQVEADSAADPLLTLKAPRGPRRGARLVEDPYFDEEDDDLEPTMDGAGGFLRAPRASDLRFLI